MFGMVVSHVNPRRSATQGMEHLGGLQDGSTRRNPKKYLVLAGRLDCLNTLAAIFDLETANPRPSLNEVNPKQMLVFQPFVKRRSDIEQIPRHWRVVRQ
jgi:hypothetical protein